MTAKKKSKAGTIEAIIESYIDEHVMSEERKSDMLNELNAFYDDLADDAQSLQDEIDELEEKIQGLEDELESSDNEVFFKDGFLMIRIENQQQLIKIQDFITANIYPDYNRLSANTPF